VKGEGKEGREEGDKEGDRKLFYINWMCVPICETLSWFETAVGGGQVHIHLGACL
jgi:hypothetical protein